MGVFGSLNRVTNLMADAPETVLVLKPALVSNPHLNQQTSVDWANATVAATVRGELQPASAEALERAGRVGRVGLWTLYCESTPLTPLGRVRINNRQYALLDVLVYRTHSEALVEEVTA